MTDWYALDRTAHTITGPMTQAAADALNDATHTINTDLGYLQDLKNQLDDEAAGGGGGGVDLAAIQAALDDGTLVVPGGGGGGGNVVHSTAVLDQTVPVADIPADGQAPVTLQALWRLSGPGVFMIGAWAEMHPVGDEDYIGMTIIGDDGSGGGGSIQLGPVSRSNAAVSGDQSLSPSGGGWLRFGSGGMPLVLVEGDHRDYRIELHGFDFSGSDSTTPISGDVGLRNCRVVAMQLDRVASASDPVTTAHDYASDGDPNGIFYALGTVDGSFINPAANGEVVTSVSAIFTPWAPPPDGRYLTDRDSSVNVMITNPDGNGDNWVQWDFGAKKVSLREYTVKSRWDQNTLHPTAFTLQGSNDGDNWDDLDVVAAVGFTAMDQWLHFVCDNPDLGPYRYIRLLDSADAHLALGEVELYGDLVAP